MAATEFRRGIGQARLHLIALAITAAALFVAGSYNVFAPLNAQANNTSAQKVDAGTLSLTLSSTSPSQGFTQAISTMAPGDTIYRYVTLTNGDEMAGRDVTMEVATASGDSAALIQSSGTHKALRIAVATCDTSWTWTAGSSSSTCTGSASALAATELGTLASPLALKVNGGSTATLAKSQKVYLRIEIALPDQDETTVNGTPPYGSVQAGQVNLTFRFSEVQRTATTENS